MFSPVNNLAGEPCGALGRLEASSRSSDRVIEDGPPSINARGEPSSALEPITNGRNLGAQNVGQPETSRAAASHHERASSTPGRRRWPSGTIRTHNENAMRMALPVPSTHGHRG
jgi:hypothetical protein